MCDRTNKIIFIISFLVLTLFGLFNLYSASYYESYQVYGVHYHIILNQAIFTLLGYFLIFVIYLIPYWFIKKLSIFAYVVSIVLMLLTSFTSMGVTIYGATRWINLPFIGTLQPSEILKFSSILLLSYVLTSQLSDKYKYSIAISSVVLGLVLILIQRAYSTTILYFLTTFTIFVVAGINIKKLIIAILFIFPLAIAVLLLAPYRILRVAGFLFPSLDPMGANYQINRSLAAIKEGGIFGKGFLNGEYKLGLLPKVHNDFIFSSIVEELGVVGPLFIIAVFLLFAFTTLRACSSNDNEYENLVSSGIVFMILIQLMINISIAVGFAPATGIPMPFFSQGGTNLLIIIAECALLFKVVFKKHEKI